MLFDNDNCSTQRALRIVALELVTLILGTFLQTAHQGSTTRYQRRIQQVCERRGMLVPLKKCIWTSLGEYGTVCVQNCFDFPSIVCYLTDHTFAFTHVGWKTSEIKDGR